MNCFNSSEACWSNQSKLKLSIRASPAVEVAAVLAVLNLQTKFNVAPLSALPPHGSSAKEALRITSQLEVDVKIYNSDRLDHTHSPLSPLPRCVHVSPQRHQLRRRHVTADRHHPDVRRWGLGARTARTWARPIREPHVTAVRPMRGEKACSPVARWSVSHFWAKLREASPSLSAPTTTGILITSRHYHRFREQQQQYHCFIKVCHTW